MPLSITFCTAAQRSIVATIKACIRYVHRMFSFGYPTILIFLHADQQLAIAEKNYKLLKRKLKYLLYVCPRRLYSWLFRMQNLSHHPQEQESLAEDLRKCRRKVLRITKEKEYVRL